MSEDKKVVELKPAASPLALSRAVYFTEAVHAIKNAPRNTGALKATTEDLLDWCTGGEYQQKTWSGDAQATWLVAEARGTWDEWEGPKALRDLFLSRFGQPEVQTFQSYEKPTILCQKCGDQGTLRSGDRYIACDCEVGRALPSNLLEMMNGVKSIDARRQAPVELPTQLLLLPGRSRSSGGE